MLTVEKLKKNLFVFFILRQGFLCAVLAVLELVL